MNTFEIEVTMLLENAEGETFTIELNDSCNTLEDVIEVLIEDLNNLKEDDEDFDHIESLENSDFEINWGNVPTWAQDFDTLEELMPIYYSSSYDIEVFEAANDCDIQFSDIDEAYSGEFKSDEDFAEDMAEQLGYMKETKNWPFNCIDWTFAAKELMYDYCTSNNHYFRNL
ncbi:MAG: Cellulophaga phage phi13:2 [Bacteroidota bacterium]|jgi:antirestriction protein